MTDLNKQILDADPESFAVEADDDIQYDPNEQSNVVAVEPMIITVGRKRRRDALRHLSSESSNK